MGLHDRGRAGRAPALTREALQALPSEVPRLGRNIVMAGGLLLLAAGLTWIAQLDAGSGTSPSSPASSRPASASA